MKKINRELKIKTELRADSVKEINKLQDKINVCYGLITIIYH